LSSPEHQEHLKKEAKSIKELVAGLVKDEEDKVRMLRTLTIYAGIMTETLLEYDEPDSVMEQAFYRISELLNSEPYGNENGMGLMPLAYELDHDVEIGRMISRNSAEHLPNYMDDMHEIAIALIISDVPDWEKNGYPRENLLLLLVEMVINAIIFEIATQDFCDMLIEDFMNGDEQRSVSESLLALSVVAGYYLGHAIKEQDLPADAEAQIMNVIIREALRNGTPGSKDWSGFVASNDIDDKKVPTYLKELDDKVKEFFEIVGQEEPLSRAVSVAKAVGRMVAVISVEDMGQIHPNVAKSIAKTGIVLGLNY